MSRIVLIVIIVIVIISGLYFYNKNKKAKIAQEQIAALPPPCVPFTKSQQDAEKRQKQANCAGKNLIPFIGQVQFIACLKNVDSTLTPVNNC